MLMTLVPPKVKKKFPRVVSLIATITQKNKMPVLYRFDKIFVILIFYVV